mmetsp:Transcript_11453/g.16319  ORF Transcript_11453/g.16319 Transcript_11453/m.16319 type:complete len:92 (+) Transcript_11453:3844-4119(+)
MPAEKQVYRADYVKLHFVHYSTVTKLMLMNREETAAFGLPWRQKIAADPLSRFSNETTEGTMLHTKGHCYTGYCWLVGRMSFGWTCHVSYR